MVSSSDCLIALSDVHKRFGSVVALNGASLRLVSGEVRALVGGNGSGKSTLAKVMMGIVDPDTGRISVNGEDHPLHGYSAAHQPRIAATFQEVSLLDDLSVEENLLLTRLPRRAGILSSPRAARSLTVEVLDQVLLPSAVLRKKVRDLPLDQRALAELAKVLLADPEIIIMDELTASLRAEQVNQVGALLQKLSVRGVATLFVSHRLEELEEFCTSCTVLRNGATVLETDRIADYSIAEYVAAMSAVGDDAGSTRTRRATAVRAGETVLAVEGLAFPGGDTQISLHARAGEIVGLGGLAGNGQSEVLRGIYGAIATRVDGMKIGDQAVGHGSIYRSMRNSMGFISGEREREMSFGQRTIGENLSVVAKALKKAVSSNQLMTRMKLVGQPWQPMRSLSGGNQQKVIVGRWLALKPRVLLADDPTRGVDVGTRAEIHRLLRELVDQGSTIVLTSSDDRELAEICDRVYIMYRGTVRAEVAGDEVSEEAIARLSVHPESLGSAA